MHTVCHAFFNLIKTPATKRCRNTKDVSGSILLKIQGCVVPEGNASSFIFDMVSDAFCCAETHPTLE
jgi:hypothetical protein